MIIKIIILAFSILSLFNNSCIFSQDSSSAEKIIKEYQPNLESILITTADVLRPGEMFFSPWGWTAIGITKDITLEWDWKMTIGGAPAGSIKIRTLKKNNFALSLQMLNYYVPPERIGEDAYPDFKEIGFVTYGNISWTHINGTAVIDKFRVHATAGLSYTPYYKTWSKDPENPWVVEQRNAINPDFWLGLEYRLNYKVQFSAGFLYGNSFILYDQNPRKTQIYLGTTLAPFPDRWWGIFSKMRINLLVFQTYFLDIDKKTGYGWMQKGISAGGYLYWQFYLFRKKNS